MICGVKTACGDVQGKRIRPVPSVASSQTLSLPLELLPLTPSSPGVLSCWGAKGAVVVGDNGVPADQSEDVIGELMYPVARGSGCTEMLF